MSKTKSPYEPIQYLDVKLSNEQATRLLHEMIEVMHGYLAILRNETTDKKLCAAEDAGAIGEMVYRVGLAIHAITAFDGTMNSDPSDIVDGLRVQEFFSDDEEVGVTAEGITYCHTIHPDLHDAVRRIVG